MLLLMLVGISTLTTDSCLDSNVKFINDIISFELLQDLRTPIMVHHLTIRIKGAVPKQEVYVLCSKVYSR